MVRAYREAGALMAAVELDLFTHIANGADDESSLTKAMGLQPLHGERIIIAMLGLGLLERTAGKLTLADDVERFLVKGKASYAGEWMLFTKPDWDDWGKLSEILKEKAPPVLENRLLRVLLSKRLDAITEEHTRLDVVLVGYFLIRLISRAKNC